MHADATGRHESGGQSVNTCTFINDAKEESIETILQLADLKKTGNCRLLVVSGCLPQRYRDELGVVKLATHGDDLSVQRLGAREVALHPIQLRDGIGGAGKLVRIADLRRSFSERSGGPTEFLIYYRASNCLECGDVDFEALCGEKPCM